jgi:PAS domain S-box-containing protein
MFLRTLNEQGQVDDYEVPLYAKDGRQLTAAINAHFHYDPDTHTPVAIEGTIRDITSRTDAEEALRTSQAMLVRAQRIAGIGSWEMHLLTREVLWSAQMYELYGLDPASFTPSFTNCLANIVPEDRPRIHAKLAEILERGTPNYDEHRIVTPAGSERTMLTHGELICDEHGQPERLVGITMDITERKRAEETILQHQQALRSLALEVSLTQERERRRLAVDLHDQISQPLVLANMQLKGLRKQSGDVTLSAALGEVAGRLEQLIKLTSTLTFELSPPILYELGFLAAVEWLAEEMQRRYQLHVVVRRTGAPPELDSELRIMLFRVVQELLMNVVKHARTTQATVHVDVDEGSIRVTVADEGCGFAESPAQPSDTMGGFGLFSIRERMQYFGGHLHIISEMGTGTRATVDLPIHTETTEREFV